MRSVLTKTWFKHWRRLPADVQALARKNYRLWKANPKHRSLGFEEKRPGLWGVRVGLRYRALARFREDTFHWIWIGSHEEYNGLLRQMR